MLGERRKADPKNVAAIILGGGNGAKLFPLTKRAATPAVSIYYSSKEKFFFFFLILQTIFFLEGSCGWML